MVFLPREGLGCPMSEVEELQLQFPHHLKLSEK